VLEASGRDELHEQPYLLSVRGRWAEMGRLVDDEVVDARSAANRSRSARLLARYGDVCDRVSFPPPPPGQGERWATVVDALHRAVAARVVSGGRLAASGRLGRPGICSRQNQVRRFRTFTQDICFAYHDRSRGRG
jgi:hypothetical protein